jgi:large subunit ribosomal protein L5
MSFYKKYYSNIIKKDYLLKFNDHNLNLTKIPKINYIILKLDLINMNHSRIISSLFALELITNNSGTVYLPKKLKLNLSFKSGHPISCKVILRKKKLYNFMSLLFTVILPNLNNYNSIIITNKKNSLRNFILNLKQLTVFHDIEHGYQFFKHLKNLSIIFNVNKSSFNEFIFLFQSFKLFIRSK